MSHNHEVISPPYGIEAYLADPMANPARLPEVLTTELSVRFAGYDPDSIQRKVTAAMHTLNGVFALRGGRSPHGRLPDADRIALTNSYSPEVLPLAGLLIDHASMYLTSETALGGQARRCTYLSEATKSGVDPASVRQAIADNPHVPPREIVRNFLIKPSEFSTWITSRPTVLPHRQATSGTVVAEKITAIHQEYRRLCNDPELNPAVLGMAPGELVSLTPPEARLSGSVVKIILGRHISVIGADFRRQAITAVMQNGSAPPIYTQAWPRFTGEVTERLVSGLYGPITEMNLGALPFDKQPDGPVVYKSGAAIDAERSIRLLLFARHLIGGRPVDRGLELVIYSAIRKGIAPAGGYVIGGWIEREWGRPEVEAALADSRRIGQLVTAHSVSRSRTLDVASLRKDRGTRS